MAVGQVIAIYTERNYRRFSDDWEKPLASAFGPSVDMARRLDQKLAAAKTIWRGRGPRNTAMGTLLLPALQASREAQVRLDREVASFAGDRGPAYARATHDGKLPERLEDINEVPVPNNPATGKPFAYRLNGTTAILELAPSTGLQAELSLRNFKSPRRNEAQIRRAQGRFFAPLREKQFR